MAKSDLIRVAVFELEKADVADWSEEDRRNAVASVAAFRDAADAFISAFGEGNPETDGTPPGPEMT